MIIMLPVEILQQNSVFKFLKIFKFENQLWLMSKVKFFTNNTLNIKSFFELNS